MYKCFAAGLLICTVLSSAFAEDAKPGIDEIMKKVNGKKGLHKKIAEELKASDVKWDDIAKQSKEYKKLVDFLGKNDPPQGSKESWEKLSKDFSENAKKLDEGVGKKDKEAVQKVMKAVEGSCAGCHKEHKP